MNDPNLENAVPIPGQSDEYSDGTLGESDQLPDNPADLPSLISDDLDRPGYDLYPREDVHRNQSLYSVSNNWNDYEGEKFDDNYNFPDCGEESSDILHTSDGQETETQDVNYALCNHSDNFSPYAINNTQIGNEESWDYSVQYGIDLDGVTEETTQVSPYHIGNEVGEINEQIDPQGTSIAWIADPQDGSTCDLEVLENKVQVNHPNIGNGFSDNPIFQEKYLKALKENIDDDGQPNWHYAVRDFLKDLHTPAQWYNYNLEDIKEALTRHHEVVVVGDPYYLDSNFYPDHGFHGINLTEVVVDEHGDVEYFKGIDPNFGYQEQVWNPQQIESMCVHTPNGVTSSLVLVSDNPSEVLSNLSPNFINDDSTAESPQLFQNPVTEISNPGEIPGDESIFSSNSADIQSESGELIAKFEFKPLVKLTDDGKINIKLDSKRVLVNMVEPYKSDHNINRKIRFSSLKDYPDQIVQRVEALFGEKSASAEGSHSQYVMDIPEGVASSDFTGIKVTYSFEEKCCDVIIPITSKENEQVLDTSSQVKPVEVSQPISTANLGWLTTHDKWLIICSVSNFAGAFAGFQKNNRIASLENMVNTALKIPKVHVGDNTVNNDRNIRVDGGDYRETHVNDQGIYVERDYYNNPEQKQTLAEAATEIQALLEQLEKTYPTDTTTGKMALATEAITQIENNPNLTARILSALKTGSFKAFEQFLSHPAASFVIGALEDWEKTKGSEP